MDDSVFFLTEVKCEGNTQITHMKENMSANNQPNSLVPIPLSLNFLAWWYVASKSTNLQNGGRQFQICRFIFLLFSDVHFLLSKFYQILF